MKNRVTMKKILVTGGAGFIGANLIRLLLDEGYEITVLDNLSAGNLAYLEGLPLEFVQGDILDVSLVNKLVVGHDGVVHLAAQTGVPGSIADPRKDCELNVIGTLNLLEAARMEQENAGKQLRFVFASSNAPLGKQLPPATEDKVPLPIAPYGASKLAGEGYCLAYNGSWDLGTIVLRFANLYGPFSAHKNSVVAKFFKDVREKGEITIDGSGGQTRDFIYVGDLCRAVQLALDSEISGEIFQIATGKETTINQLAEMIQQMVSQQVQVGFAPARLGDIYRNYSGVRKVGQMLGWTADVELTDGLAKTLAWFKEDMSAKLIESPQ